MRKTMINLGISLVLVCVYTVMARGEVSMTPSASTSFIWVGTSNDKQFTEKEYQYIASHYSYVVISKYHAGWDIKKHHEAARELKALNPQIKVLPYYSAKLWFKKYQFGQDIRNEWFVRDRQGGTITIQPRGEGNAYVNLDDPSYRQWAINLLSGWMNLTLPNGKPLYDGVAFDTANIFNIYEPKGLASPKIRRLIGLVGKEKLNALNEGMKAFFRETKQRFGDRLVIYNGIEDRDNHYKRSLELLDITDGALDEDFCFSMGNPAGEQEIMENVAFMLDKRYASKLLFEKASIKTIGRTLIPPREVAQYQRYCYGSFLLGHQPGHTFFKFAAAGPGEPLYSASAETETHEGLSVDPSELQIALGNPLANYSRDGAVYSRDFEHGSVYVNMKNTPQRTSLKSSMTGVQGNAAGKKFNAGETIEIAPSDAAFLLKSPPK
jgi:hypothetical protein